MIGFRLKFDNISKCNLKKFLLDYISKFDFFEVKLTKDLLMKNKLRSVLELSEEYASGKFSIHLPKDFLNSEFDETVRQIIIQYLKELKCNTKISLILHLPAHYDKFFLYELFKLLIDLPENYCILLENEKVNNLNLEYLKSINDIMGYLLETKKYRNVGICFDIGHFQYGIMKEEVSKKIVYSSLLELKYFLEYVREYHLHDYNKERDHLQLKTGFMRLEEISKYMKGTNCNIPIIIETNIINPDLDGKRQIDIVKTEILMKET